MLLRLLIGAGIGALAVLLAVRYRVLTLAAALLAAAMLLAILAFGGYVAGGYILVIFALCAAVSTWNKKKKSHHTGEARGVRQVACNGGVGVLLLCGYAIFPEDALLVGYYAAVAEFLVDSLASDIGTHSRRRPIDLCRFCLVAPGESGGISLLGTLAAFLGSLLCFLLILPARLSLGDAAIAAGAAFLGMLIDSVLGSLLQGKFRCTVCGKTTERCTHCGAEAEHLRGLRCLTNSGVNAVSNLLTGAIAVLLSALL